MSPSGSRRGVPDSPRPHPCCTCDNLVHKDIAKVADRITAVGPPSCEAKVPPAIAAAISR